MIELIKYQLIVTICIIVFYGFYKIFLKNETFFNFNRFLILFLISISFAIPLVKIGTSLPIVPQKPNIITIGQSSEMVTQPIAEAKTSIPIKTANQPTPINWNLITLYAIGIINLAGILWGLNRLTKSLLFFRYLRRKSEIATFNITKFYIVPETIGSFSFFNSIFISKETINKGEVGSILAHELTHINEHHSIDSIFLAIVKSFLWFNPIIYLFEKELKTIHEYIADSSVIKKEQDKNNYIDILLNQTIGPKMFDLTNNFNSTTIFRRIKMITKAKSTKRTLWKYLILILPITFTLYAFSFSALPEPQERGKSVIDDIIHQRGLMMGNWDQDPKPITTEKDNDRIINSILQIPDEAKKHNITCQLWVYFDINTDSTMSNFKFLRGKICGEKMTEEKIGYGLTDEAFRVMNELSKTEKWIPATLQGKPVKSIGCQSILFGDKEVWDMYNVEASSTYMYFDSEISVSNPCKGDIVKNPSWFTANNFNQIFFGLRYPEKALKAKKGGKVVVAFGITPNGDVDNPKVKKGAGYGIDEAALKAVQNVKSLKTKWFKHEGKRYNIEFKFTPKGTGTNTFNITAEPTKKK